MHICLQYTRRIYNFNVKITINLSYNEWQSEISLSRHYGVRESLLPRVKKQSFQLVNKLEISIIEIIGILNEGKENPLKNEGSSIQCIKCAKCFENEK